MGSSLKFEAYEMPAAGLGKPNPLPDISEVQSIHANVAFDDSIPVEERHTFGFGRVKTKLPYLTLDGYDRDKKPRKFNAAVLENEHLKAVFLPEVGGRLWSLYDKDEGCELVHKNPVFQPANLAIRNAWVSGGTEWNIGILGHSPFTVSPLFAARYEMEDKTPVLRMYEWERIRRASFQIDAFLPAGSKFLFVRVQIVNTKDFEIPMYWWSNTAVNEAEDVRVVAPADRAYGHDYNRAVAKVEIPISEGIDKSYTTRVPRAMDWFFDIPAGSRKWECAVNSAGYGLLQASTDRLRGRKLFMWGNSQGGKRWQEFLAAPGCAYLEIQAGIISTQMQSIPMPANAKWDWLEAYGALHTCPEAVHGEWKAAYTHINGDVDRILPIETLESTLEKIRAAAAAANANANAGLIPERMGSGWAALEAARAAAAGEGFDVDGLCFPESSMDEEQRNWLSLLKTGALPEPDVCAEPESYMIHTEWLDLLKKSIDAGKSDHWYAWLQLGVLYYANDELAKCEEAFRTSFERRPNAWALRNLGALRRMEGDLKAAAEKLYEAVELLKQKHIVLECGKTLIAAGMYAEFKSFEESLPQELREHGRIRVYNIEASIHFGELEKALKIFGEDLTVNDVREGELLLSDLWVLLHKKILVRDTGADESQISDDEALERYPLPESIDFRMSAKKK